MYVMKAESPYGSDRRPPRAQPIPEYSSSARGRTRTRVSPVARCRMYCWNGLKCWTEWLLGPPGTGKTRTIVSMIHAMLADQSTPDKKRILLCAPSNAAVDEVALRYYNVMYSYSILQATCIQHDKVLSYRCTYGPIVTGLLVTQP